MSDLKNILVNVGAIAGFAGIVGLAVLAMLYFSQARDVRRLREWAGREPERAGEVELRAQQIASQAIAQAYESMAVRQSEADAAAGIAEEQGVDVSTPLVAEAIDEHSEAVPAAGEAIDPHPTEQHDVAAEFANQAAGESADEAAASEAAGADRQLETAEGGQQSGADHPAEALPSSNGAGDGTVVHPPPVPAEGAASDEAVDQRPSRLAPSTPAAARGGTPLPPLPPLDTSEFRSVNRPPTPPIPDYYLAAESTGSGHFDSIALDDEPHRSRVPFAVAGVLVAIFAVILIATQIGGGSGTTASNGANERRAARDQRTLSTSPRNPEINRPAVTISVLNGTNTAGLAKVVSDKLTQAGFTDNTPGNRNDGTNHAISTVYYASGSKLEAQEVARELKIKDVKQADDQTLAAGGSVPVIVVLGADIAQ